MEELIDKAKSGDKEAFTTLILENKRELYCIAKSKLNNESDIEDAIQETVIKAYVKLKTLKDNSKFKYWIFKILINECNKVYRQRKVQEVAIDDLENNISDNADDLNKEYKEVMNLLKDDEKILITLFYSSGYTTKEISEFLHKNENTIKTKLRRIREKLRDKLNDGKEG